MRYSDLRTFLLIAAFGSASFFPTVSEAAGPYTDSAHGNTNYGVSRSEIATAGFARGNCAHCHEQHASVGGSEPAPVNVAADEHSYLIFDKNNNDQTRNFCFNCHGTGTGYQDGVHVVNRSYSFRAGGWTTETLNNVKDAFSKVSSHNLADIVTFVTDKAWTNTTTNACGVCHDPHQVQGDPGDYSTNGSNPKSDLTRGVAITEINSLPVNLWGDGFLPDLVTANAIEIMSNYTANYLAPNRINGGSEPDGSVTTNGSNLANYVNFCTTCHDTTATTFGSRTLKVINWATEKHGQGVADIDIQMNVPYVSGNGALGYVLSCLDCHEPHGSDNVFLLRGAVNGNLTLPPGGTPQYTTPINSGVKFGQLCSQCHNPLPLGGVNPPWDDVHHSNTSPLDGPYQRIGSPDCNSVVGCHLTAAGTDTIDCSGCHYHGAAIGTNNPVAGGTILAPDLVVGTNSQTF
ncbi:MAG: cytochrome c3 family protein [Desulfobulbales bacterium]|nr:cytochrome c3 family protein [Desulfobulbales bacterium]